jgi:hypothetical protein
MTTQQIEVLARFDGWKKMQVGYRKMITVFNKALGGEIEVPENRRDTEFFDYFTSPAVLIEMRLKIGKIGRISVNYVLWPKYEQLGNLILSGEYTAAAIKTVEIIEKIEA